MTLTRLTHALIQQAGSAITNSPISPREAMVFVFVGIGSALAGTLIWSVTPKNQRQRATVCAVVVGLALGGMAYGLTIRQWPWVARIEGSPMAIAFGVGTFVTKVLLLGLDQLPQTIIDGAKNILVAAAGRIASPAQSTPQRPTSPDGDPEKPS